MPAPSSFQFFDRLKLFGMPAKHQPDFIYLRHVPLRKVHLFTLIQLTCLVLLWVIKASPAAIVFPMMVSPRNPLSASRCQGPFPSRRWTAVTTTHLLSDFHLRKLKLHSHSSVTPHFPVCPFPATRQSTPCLCALKHRAGPAWGQSHTALSLRLVDFTPSDILRAHNVAPWG